MCMMDNIHICPVTLWGGGGTGVPKYLLFDFLAGQISDIWFSGGVISDIWFFYGGLISDIWSTYIYMYNTEDHPVHIELYYESTSFNLILSFFQEVHMIFCFAE